MNSATDAKISVPSISVVPQNALIDERINICISGLESSQPITVHCRVTENGVKFASFGCFVADFEGTVNISQADCVDGTYKGKDAMGLFWSTRAEPGFENKRFLKSDVTTPMVFTVYIYDGFFTWGNLYDHSKKLVTVANTEIRRWYKSLDVQRIEIREGNLRGTLFIPNGKGPFPAIVDMFGGIGGLVEIRAALLASRGFLTLALAYFAFEDLPENYRDVKMEYFQEASSWLSFHPLTMPGGIGTAGVSYGGAFSCAMATYFKEVVAAVVINTAPNLAGVVEKGDEIHEVLSAGFDLNKLKKTDEGYVLKDCFTNQEKYLVKGWESDARFLCFTSEDDQCTDPALMEKWYSNWPMEHKHKIEFVKYRDAGHLIEPPYSPLLRVTAMRSPLSGLGVWGGKPEGHAHAQEDSWSRILQFFRENVPKQNVRNTHSRL